MTVSGPGSTAKHANAPSWFRQPHQGGKPHEDGLQSVARPGLAGGKNLASADRKAGGTGQESDRSDPSVPPKAPSTRIDQRGSAPELLVLRGSGGGEKSVSFSRAKPARVALAGAKTMGGHGSKDHTEKAHDSDEVGGHFKAGYGRHVFAEKTPGGP
jgi:hypothetical protein